MTKVSIKVISVILCAVMVVGCCFVGCEDDNINDVTLTQLLEALKVEYPDAHIYNGILYDSNGEMDVNGGTFILLTDSENSGMSVGRFFGYDNNPDEYSVSKSQDSVNIYQIKTKEDCKKILNTIMPLYSNEWSSSVTNDFFVKTKPNEDFTSWDGSMVFIYKNFTSIAYDNDGMSVGIIYR